MKRTASFVIELMAWILMCSVAQLHAQSNSAVTVSVPIPFTVGTQRIAPGTYRFSLVSTPFLLSVLNLKTGHQEMFEVRPEQERLIEPHGWLVFGKNEDASFLREVHFPGTDRFTQVIQPHRIASLDKDRLSSIDSVAVAKR